MPYGLDPSFQQQGQDQQPGAAYPRPPRWWEQQQQVRPAAFEPTPAIIT